jgi:hypothetical protein
MRRVAVLHLFVNIAALALFALMEPVRAAIHECRAACLVAGRHSGSRSWEAGRVAKWFI